MIGAVSRRHRLGAYPVVLHDFIGAGHLIDGTATPFRVHSPAALRQPREDSCGLDESATMNYFFSVDQLFLSYRVSRDKGTKSLHELIPMKGVTK